MSFCGLSALSLLGLLLVVMPLLIVDRTSAKKGGLCPHGKLVKIKNKLAPVPHNSSQFKEIKVSKQLECVRACMKSEQTYRWICLSVTFFLEPPDVGIEENCHLSSASKSLEPEGLVDSGGKKTVYIGVESCKNITVTPEGAVTGILPTHATIAPAKNSK